MSSKAKTLLIDAPSGIAGDMFLAGLAGLGFDLAELEKAFLDAGIDGLSLSIDPVKSHGLAGGRLKIVAPDSQPHRHLSHCLEIVNKLALPDRARELAERMFRRLATVEAGMHASSPDKVHFHEVGALDSLVDIIGAALGLARLGIDQVYLRELSVGRGSVKTQHGELPLPAPATMALLEGLPLRESGIGAELVTPTGALILAEASQPMPTGLAWRPRASAYGAGTRELPDRPNLLRLTLADVDAAGDVEGVATLKRRQLPLIRCTIDDMNPERFGYLMERLLAAGALDVHYRPIQMKKNRPGLEVEVLGPAERAGLDALVELIFAETTTLGLRVAWEERIELPREIVSVQTASGEVHMKVATLPGGGRRAAPEFEDCARLARESGLPIASIEESARAAWLEMERSR